MTVNSHHIYFDECSLLGIFNWRSNLKVELSTKTVDGLHQAHTTITEETMNGQRGVMVEVAGKGQRFVTDTASVKAARKYIKSAIDDGMVDAREGRVLFQMAIDLLDGKLDGKYHNTPINNREYSRALQRLQVA